MPTGAASRRYVIEQRDDGWCLLTADKSRVLGCHDTKEDAEAQERAIEARTNAKDSFDLRNVEIFATGEHNGDTYTEADLDEMVRAYNDVGFVPPLKSGHTKDTPGAPALGWVENLRRVGSKLVADFAALPKAVYEAIRNRRYDSVSAEIYFDFERGKKVFRRVLKAVALLGADIPAVPDLLPLHERIHEKATVKSYAVHLGGIPMKELRFSIGEMTKLCPSCAAKMRDLRISEFIVKPKADGSYQLPDELQASLCEKFGPAEGFRTRCAEAELGDFVPDDKDAFCNWLKEQCGLMTATKETTQMKTLEEAQARIKELEAQLIAAKPNEIKVVIEKLKAAESEISSIREERRQERITARTNAVTLPAFRPHIRALYEIATANGTKTVKFSKDGKTAADTPAEAVVDALVADLNAKAAKLFSEETTATVKREAGLTEDDPAKEADVRARRYMLDKGEKDYTVALHAVLDADLDLKAAYAGR